MLVLSSTPKATRFFVKDTAIKTTNEYNFQDFITLCHSSNEDNKPTIYNFLLSTFVNVKGMSEYHAIKHLKSILNN